MDRQVRRVSIRPTLPRAANGADVMRHVEQSRKEREISDGWRSEYEEVELLRLEHQAGRASWDQVVNAAGRMRTKATRPLMRDLRAAGVRGRDLWDELDIKAHPAAIPVLIEYLESGDLPEDVLVTVGNLLSIRVTAAYWERVKAIYLEPRSAGQEEGAAIALSGCASREHYDELVDFVKDGRRGPDRVHFLHKVSRLGGSEGWEVIESVAHDPHLALPIGDMLKRRARRMKRSN